MAHSHAHIADTHHSHSIDDPYRMPVGQWKLLGILPSTHLVRLFCILSLVKIEVRGRENIDKNTSYVFVSNHQGAYDIFLIYGYLNHNFKWMMKKSLRNIPFVGSACAAAGHIFVDNSTPAD